MEIPKEFEKHDLLTIPDGRGQEKPSPAANDAVAEKRSRKRKLFPETLPRETLTHLPQATDCPDLGGQFKLVEIITIWFGLADLEL